LIGAFLAEWVILRRRSLILSSFGPLLFFTFVGTVFAILGVDEPGGNRGPFGPTSGIEQLSSAGGLTLGLESSSTFIGLIILSVFAVNLAREYSNGTIRLLLVSEPRRARLLAGILLALGAFTAIAVVLAGILSIALSFAMAPGQGIPTGEWATSDGIFGAVATIGRTIAATLVWGLIGAMIVMVTKSSAAAIATGAGGLLIFPTMLRQVADGVTDRFPDAVLRAFLVGGNDALSGSTAALMTAAYGVLCLALLFTIFLRRDITD